MLSNQKNYAYLYDICGQIADLYRSELDNAGAVAEGDLKNFSWDIDWGKGSFQLVFNLPSYWEQIEFGRGPTTGSNPPWPSAVEDIKRWISVKHIVPKPKSNGQVPTIDETARSIVWKIHKVGYEARHPFEKALDKADNLVDMLADYIEQEFESTLMTQD